MVYRHLLQIRQTHLRCIVACQRNKAALGQTALQRHLAAFKTDLVKTAGARFLSLVTASSSLAQTGTDTTADAALGMLGAFCRLEFY